MIMNNREIKCANLRCFGDHLLGIVMLLKPLQIIKSIAFHSIQYSLVLCNMGSTRQVGQVSTRPESMKSYGFVVKMWSWQINMTETGHTITEMQLVYWSRNISRRNHVEKKWIRYCYLEGMFIFFIEYFWKAAVCVQLNLPSVLTFTCDICKHTHGP